MRRGTGRARGATAKTAAQSPGLDHAQQPLDSLLHLAEVAASFDNLAGAADGGSSGPTDQGGPEHPGFDQEWTANDTRNRIHNWTAAKDASVHHKQAPTHNDESAATVTALLQQLQQLKEGSVEEPSIAAGQQGQQPEAQLDGRTAVPVIDNTSAYGDRIAAALAAATAAHKQHTVLPPAQLGQLTAMPSTLAAAAPSQGVDSNLLADVISKMEPANAAALLTALGTWSSSAADALAAAGAGVQPSANAGSRSAGAPAAAAAGFDSDDEASDSAGTAGGKPQRWTDEEHTQLEALVEHYGSKNWTAIAGHLPGRTGKQCRERYLNHTSKLKKGNWQLHEEAIIAQLHSKWGNKWAAIARHLPGRSDNCLKNHWNTVMRSKRPAHVRTSQNLLWLYCQGLRQGLQPAEAFKSVLAAMPEDDRAKLGLEDSAPGSPASAGPVTADPAAMAAAAAAIFGSSLSRATSSATLGGAAQSYVLGDAAGQPSAAEAAAVGDLGDIHPAALAPIGLPAAAGPHSQSAVALTAPVAGASQPASDPVAAAATVVLAAVAAAARQGGSVEPQPDAEALAAAAAAVARVASQRYAIPDEPQAAASPAPAVAGAARTESMSPVAEALFVAQAVQPAVEQDRKQQQQEQWQFVSEAASWSFPQQQPTSTQAGTAPSAVMQFLTQALQAQQQQQVSTLVTKQAAADQPGAQLQQQQPTPQHLTLQLHTQSMAIEVALGQQTSMLQQQNLALQQQQQQPVQQLPSAEPQQLSSAAAGGASAVAAAATQVAAPHTSGTVLAQLLAAAVDATAAGKASAAAASVTAAINMVRAYYGRGLVQDGSESGYVPADEYLRKLQASSIGAAAGSGQPQQQGRGHGTGRGRGGRGRSKAATAGRGAGAAGRSAATSHASSGQGGLSALVFGMINQKQQQATDQQPPAATGSEALGSSRSGSGAVADLGTMLQLLKPKQGQQQQRQQQPFDNLQQVVKHKTVSKLVVCSLSSGALATTVSQKRVAARRSRQRVLEQLLLTHDPTLRQPTRDTVHMMQVQPALRDQQVTAAARQEAAQQDTAPEPKAAHEAAAAAENRQLSRQQIELDTVPLDASAAIDALPTVATLLAPTDSAAATTDVASSSIVAHGHARSPAKASAAAQLDLATLTSTAEGLKLLEGLKALQILPADLSLGPGVQLTVQLQMQATPEQAAAAAAEGGVAHPPAVPTTTGAGSGGSPGSGEQQGGAAEPLAMEVDAAAEQPGKLPSLDAAHQQTAAAASTPVKHEPANLTANLTAGAAAAPSAAEPAAGQDVPSPVKAEYKVGSKRPASAMLPEDALAATIVAAKRVLCSAPTWGAN